MKKLLVERKVEVDDCEFDEDYLIVTIVKVYEVRPGFFGWLKGLRRKVKECKEQYRSKKKYPARWYIIPDYRLVNQWLQIELDEIRDRRMEFDKYITAIEKHGNNYE